MAEDAPVLGKVESRSGDATLRLLCEQVNTQTRLLAQYRADLREMDGQVDGLSVQMGVLWAAHEAGKGNGPRSIAALGERLARVETQVKIALGIMGALQLITIAVSSYLAARAP
jgi:hypothetical protein